MPSVRRIRSWRAARGDAGRRRRCASRWSSSVDHAVDGGQLAVEGLVQLGGGALVELAGARPRRGARSRSASWAADDRPIQRSTTSARRCIGQPSSLEHPRLDDDGEPLGVDEHAVAVEDHQVRAGHVFAPRAATGQVLDGRAAADHHELVGEVDGVADVVGHDAHPAAERRQRPVRPGDDRVVLGEQRDPRVGVVQQPALAGGPRRPVGAERLAAGVEHDPAAGVADHRGAGRSARRRSGCDGAELPLLRVAEHVDARAQLGEHAGVGGSARSASSRR